MGAAAGPDITNDKLILAFDVNNIQKSWKGKPSNNLVNDYKNFTGTNYGFYGEWSETTILKEYLPDVNTPIGKGATKITESSTYGWQCLSRLGGGGTGNDSLSLFVYPLTSITRMDCGLLGSGTRCKFYFETMSVVEDGNTSNGFIKKINGYNNWYRIGANMGGRNGGWVGSIGFDTRHRKSVTSFPQSAIVTGLQYEYEEFPTSFLLPNSIRDNNNSITDAVNKSNIVVNSLTYNKDNTFEFNGIDDYIYIYPELTRPNQFTCQGWIYPENQYARFITPSANGIDNWVGYNNANQRLELNYTQSADTNNRRKYSISGDVPYQTWTNFAIAIDDRDWYIWINGELKNSGTESFQIGTWDSRWTVGQRGNGSYYFKGKLNKLLVYDKVLSNNEIVNNFNSTKSLYGI